MIYETDADREREETIMTEVAQRWRVRAERTPRLFPLDYGLFRGDVLSAWAEVKTRRVTHDRYPDFLITTRKWDAGMAYAERFGVPFVLIVRFEDGIWYWRAKDIKPRVWFLGRYDRTADAAREPHAVLPMSCFTKF